ncbi:MAG: hypothetical protein ACM359_06140 [Bacillota bacterium]
MTTRKADSKGRIVLGEQYANTTLLVEENPDGSVTLRPAVTVPAREAWLYNNPAASKLVFEGLRQARQRQTTAPGPDLTALQSWIDDLAD